MKKIVSLALLLALMATMLFACKTDQKNDSEKDKDNSDISMKDFIDLLENAAESAKLYYNFTDEGVYINSHYSEKNDISYYLCQKGPNEIFDFSTVGLVKASIPVSDDVTPSKYLVKKSGDWHAPYVVRATSNGDGDNKESEYFTGGNHSFTNTASGVSTARTENLKMYANGKYLESYGDGYANSFKIEWDNYIQGYNTTKEDGSGREILREHITMKFDGETWDTETTIYPLENIVIEKWYGLQFFTQSYSHVAYIGGKTGLIAENNENTEAGNLTANSMKFFNLSDTAIIEIDTTYGLGKREGASESASGFFTRSSYGKAYGTVINTPTEFEAMGAYSIRGSYTFKYEKQDIPDTK